MVPELRLWLLGDDVDLERDTRELGLGDAAPYWAFCWGSGQALARYLLDRPDEVRGKRVVDWGAGSGVVALAASRAGAACVWAVDIDPEARSAIRRNAALNELTVRVTAEMPADWDVLLAADVLYEPANLERLRALARAPRQLLLSDPERGAGPKLGIDPILRVEARTLPDVDSPMRTAAIFRLA